MPGREQKISYWLERWWELLSLAQNQSPETTKPYGHAMAIAREVAVLV